MNMTCWMASKAVRRQVGHVGQPDERDVGERSRQFDELLVEHMGKGQMTGDGHEGA